MMSLAPVLKDGIYTDPAKREKIAALARYKTTTVGGQMGISG